MSKANLYLIPNVISEQQTDVIPEQVKEVIRSTGYYLVENIRTARRFISSLKLGVQIEGLHFEVLDKNTPAMAVERLMKPIYEGKDMGIFSESGCPGIADPGSEAVIYAHAHHINVIPLVGPSAIFLSLMASGLNGQRFAFHGYLPIDKAQLLKSIKAIEDESRKKNQTQIFIETPYRNNHLFETLIKSCHPETLLCVAKDISGKESFIKTRRIKAWKAMVPELHKIPTVFLLQAGK